MGPLQHNLRLQPAANEVQPKLLNTNLNVPNATETYDKTAKHAEHQPECTESN